MRKVYQRKCLVCKEKFTPQNNTQIVCGPEHALEYLKKQRSKEWKEQKKVIKQSLETKSDVLKAAQIVFNTYIRLRDKGKPCISCNAINYTSSCGHYYSSGNHKNVTFNEDNCHAQCWYYCNSKLSGNLIEYRKGLIERIGIERLEQLDSIAKIEKKFTFDELKELIYIYKEKIKELKNG